MEDGTETDKLAIPFAFKDSDCPTNTTTFWVETAQVKKDTQNSRGLLRERQKGSTVPTIDTGSKLLVFFLNFQVYFSVLDITELVLPASILILGFKTKLSFQMMFQYDTQNTCV